MLIEAVLTKVFETHKIRQQEQFCPVVSVSKAMLQ